MSEPARIVFLMTDTQRWDMVGCYGNPAMRTPNLDRLASQGVRFERAYTCQPVCEPARAAIFTGVWPHGNNGWTNSQALAANVPSLGQRLSRAGYHTAYMGKWHLDGGDYFGLGQCPEGWDPAWWYDMRNYLEELTPEERAWSRDGRNNRAPGGVRAEFTFGHRCASRAIDFLEKHGSERFCLVVSFDEPHGPSLCPPEYLEAFRDFRFPRSPNVDDPLDGKPAHQRAWAGKAVEQDRSGLELRPVDLLACNSFVDSQIGRVLAAVDRLAPDALVVYTSDHGDALASHRIGGKGPCGYDEITRIPLLARWPGRIPAASVCPHPASHIDLVPTLLEAAGHPVPPSVDGHSMLPTLVDPSLRPAEAIFIEFGRYEVDHDGFGGFQPMRAAFDGRWKLVVNLLSDDELYDLVDDPYELRNRIGDPACAAVRDALHDRMLEWMNATRDPFRGYYWERRPWRRDARPATWAYTGMTRQAEREWEPRQLDYDTGLPMREATRRK